MDCATVSMSVPMVEPVISARDVHVRFRLDEGIIHAVKGIGLDIHAGETVALVGESGSGKSALAKAFLRLHQPPFTTPRTSIDGEILLNADGGSLDLVSIDEPTMRRVRAREIGIIFQDALSALNPVLTVGDQVKEALASAQPQASRSETFEGSLSILERIDMPDPKARATLYPHQLSGGQRQRVMIAIAAIRRPRLLIADEPTTALDVTIQARLLALLKDIQSETGMAMLFITHDLGIVADIANSVAVMREGEIVERSTPHALFNHARHSYSKTLIESLPGRGTKRSSTGNPPGPTLIDLSNISVTFGGGLLRQSPPVTAVNDVSLQISRGERLGIVGESGSGKSTLGRVMLGLQQPTEGRLLVAGRDPYKLDGKEALAFRKRVQTVFQDTAAALDPRMTVGASIQEGLDVHGIGTSAERRSAVSQMLERVGLEPAMAARYPHMLSGGQRQRVNIARSLILEPEILIADEPVSALDVSIQAQILDLLNELHKELDLTLVFISHDLWVVRELCDTVAVMQEGRIVEHDLCETVFEAPQHPYTRLLLNSVSGAITEEEARAFG
jgi:ABC-type glutathione transport system ATPase component